MRTTLSAMWEVKYVRIEMRDVGGREGVAYTTSNSVGNRVQNSPSRRIVLSRINNMSYVHVRHGNLLQVCPT